MENPENSPIDLVYTWVNSADKKWQAEYKVWAKKLKPVGQNANSIRYKNVKELVHSLRSVDKFAPWIRYVFLVVSRKSQLPPWLNLNNPKLRIIYHHQIMPKAFLPTFNSMAIEMHLHLIPELSENYIYFNDDCFFGRVVKPTDFVNGNKTYIYLSKQPITKRKSGKGYDFMAGLSHTNDLVNKFIKPRKTHFKTKHVGQVFNKTAMRQVFKLLKNKKLYSQTCSRFRQTKNVQVVSLFYPYYALEKGFAVPGNHISGLKYSQKHDVGCKVIMKIRPHMFCLNNVNKMEPYLIKFYTRYFPEKSSFEV